MVASHVITMYSGQPYISFVEEWIFTLLDMMSTFSPTKVEPSGKFTQEQTKQGWRLPECFDKETALLDASPGGVILNAIDIVSLYT